MGHPHKALRTTAVGVVSATLIAGTTLGLAPAAQASTTAGVRFVDIAGDGGTILKANVITPAGAMRRIAASRSSCCPRAGVCLRSSTSPRPRSSRTPVTSWSVTTSAASGSPAGR